MTDKNTDEKARTRQPVESTQDIITYQVLGKGIFAMTRDEFNAAGGIPKDWDDFIWQSTTSKQIAIARHDDALDAYTDDLNTGRTPKETY